MAERATVVVIAGGLAIALSAPCARAQPPPAPPQAAAADRETARRLVYQGDDLAGRGDFEGALKAYTAADAIMGVPTTSVEVAKTLAKLGRLLEARDAALRVVRFPARSDEPAVFAAARAQADALAGELAARIPTLTLQVSGAHPGETVSATVDGIALPPESLGLARTLDPGAHVATATTPSCPEAREEVTLAQGEARVLALALSCPPPVAVVPAPPGNETAAPSPTLPPAGGGRRTPSQSSRAALAHEASSDDAWPISPVSIGAFAVAGAGVVVGTITGALSLATAADVESQCGAALECSHELEPTVDRGLALAHASTVSFAVAGAAAAVGTVALFVDRPESDPPSSKATPRAQAWLALDLGGARVRGRF